jgi:hypothetical protein
MVRRDDLNNEVITGDLTRPIDFADPMSFLELKVVNGRAVPSITLHVPAPLRRVLYTLGPGDRSRVRGQLADNNARRLATGGQPCIKASVMAPLERHSHRQQVAHPEASRAGGWMMRTRQQSRREWSRELPTRTAWYCIHQR